MAEIPIGHTVGVDTRRPEEPAQGTTKGKSDVSSLKKAGAVASGDGLGEQIPQNPLQKNRSGQRDFLKELTADPGDERTLRSESGDVSAKLRKRGRPFGAKDRKPRQRRRAEERAGLKRGRDVDLAQESDEISSFFVDLE